MDLRAQLSHGATRTCAGREVALKKILIIGGGGMLGQKLARKLAEGEGCALTIFDRQINGLDVPHRAVVGELSDRTLVDQVVADRPDVIFHLAAIVSGQAEAEFELGWEVNLTATRALLERLRQEHESSGKEYRPRFVFSSSLAVFGPPYPEHIPDTFHTAPQSSYGAQKAMGELLVAEYARRGFIDGVSLRLPTVCVRPGAPNRAASSFLSAIIREPLNGHPASLPVPSNTRHWLTSPRTAVGFLAHAAALPGDALATRRILNMPGVSCTVEEQIEALRRVGGEEAVALITPAPDPVVAQIVGGWPQSFAPEAALALGFTGEADFDEIVQIYLEDDFTPPL